MGEEEDIDCGVPERGGGGGGGGICCFCCIENSYEGGGNGGLLTEVDSILVFPDGLLTSVAVCRVGFCTWVLLTDCIMTGD